MNMFPLTLWHGTSAHLLPTIQEYGLGGQDQMADWRVMEFLRVACEILDVAEDDWSNPDLADLQTVMIAVRGGAAGMNFEYGSLYVAGGFVRAADYSLRAPELISFVRAVLIVADRRGDELVRRELSNFPEIADFIGLEAKPVVLKLPPIPIENVRNERGGDAHLPDNLSDPVIKEVLLRQMAFRVIGVVPFDEIEVFDTSSHKHSFGAC